MTNILNDIIESKHFELKTFKKRYKNISGRINTSLPPRFLRNFMDQNKVKIIAEIKPSSPSLGKIFEPTKNNIKDIAKIYSQYPLGAISILTDYKYFNGSFENISIVKEITDIPILCKEFIIDEFQIDLAKYFQADAVLLITEILTEKRSIELYNYAGKMNLDVLFECHTKEKLDFLLKMNANIIGINNRNLDTLKVNIQNCIDLKETIPFEKITIAESGINSKEQIKILEENKFSGVLTGTSILRSKDKDKKLKEMVYYYE